VSQNNDRPRVQHDMAARNLALVWIGAMLHEAIIVQQIVEC
jgi:hypothetical protein